MKKVVRTVWISLLSGLAFLVACTSSKGLSRSEKKHLKEERTAIIAEIDQKRQESQIVEDAGIMLRFRDNELGLRQRLGEINELLGDDEAKADNEKQIGIIHNEMDSLVAVLEKDREHPLLYGVPIEDPTYLQRLKDRRRNELTTQLNQLMEAIKQRENACVYGSPEVIQSYDAKTRRMKQEATELRKELQELDNDGSTTGEK